MIAPIERRARVFAALYVVATTVASLFLLPVEARSQLAVPVSATAEMMGTDGPLGAAVASSFAAFSVSTEAAAAAATAALAPASPGATPSRAAPAPALPALPVSSSGFRAHQLQFPRVREAYQEKWQSVGSLLHERGVPRPAEIFLRVFKREQELEVWARNHGEHAFTLVRSYPVCELSGRLGPKRMEGDGQVPEGFYSIDLFNPRSDYHLSMRVSYPNAVDRFRSGRTGRLGANRRLGGDIYIHGGCATIGCVPIGDEWVEELYLIAVEARDAGQRRIPVHIFPTRLDGEGMRWLAGAYGRDFVDYPLWENLQEGYVAFERSRTLPAIESYAGRYVVVPAPDLPAPIGPIAGFH